MSVTRKGGSHATPQRDFGGQPPAVEESQSRRTRDVLMNVDYNELRRLAGKLGVDVPRHPTKEDLADALADR